MVKAASVLFKISNTSKALATAFVMCKLLYVFVLGRPFQVRGNAKFVFLSKYYVLFELYNCPNFLLVLGLLKNILPCSYKQYFADSYLFVSLSGILL